MKHTKKVNFIIIVMLAIIGPTSLAATIPFFTKSFQQFKKAVYAPHYQLPQENTSAAVNPLTSALGFNAFVEYSTTTINGDMDGPLALGGDLNIAGSLTIAGLTRGTFKIGSDTLESGLIIGGAVNYLAGSGINLVQSALLKIGDSTGSNIHDMFNGSPVSTRVNTGGFNANPKISVSLHQPASSIVQSNVIDFTSAFTSFRDYSIAISNLPATQNLTNNAGSSTVTLLPNQVNVINITGTALNAINSLTFNDTPSQTQPLIINVDASSTFSWTMFSTTLISDVQGPYILYNFYNADFLNLDGGSTIIGNVLAPDTDLTKSGSGNIAGQVVSKAYTHAAGELHYYPLDFTVDLNTQPTEICDNNQDDDNDGLVDAYDDDCCVNLSIIPQNNYSLHFVDSENNGVNDAINAFDGNTETYWQTNLDNTTYPTPHDIQLDLGATYKIGGLRYLPVPISEDGRIANYEVYVSADGSSWGSPVAIGTLNYDHLGDKEINFSLTEGRYIRLVALSEVNGNGWTSAVEINVLECKGQEICDDNIDNDGDGLIDCDDPDCSANVSLSATTATNCGDNITISSNYCIDYTGTIAHFIGNIMDESATIAAPDGTAAFLHEVSDGTYTRMVWDFGEIIPDGETVCFKVRGSSETTQSDVSVWLLNNGTPDTGYYDLVTTQSFVGIAWQDLCFKMPRASRYIKITDDSGAPFYLDAVGRKCRDVNTVSYSWDTGETTASIDVNGALSTSYAVTVTSPGACQAIASINVVGISGCPEICNNGIDDDGDGFADSGDSDCNISCNESLLFVARNNAKILQVNLNTGAISIAGTSPYTSDNLNAMAANPDAEIVYYGHHQTVYYWNPVTGTHGTLINLNGQVGNNEILTSGGGAYFNNQLYLGFEDEFDSDDPSIYRLNLSPDGLSVTGNATNLNVPIPSNTSWGDMIVSAEGGQTVIYAGLGYNGDSNQSLYFKYEVENANFTTIRTDMPSALQIGVDVNGNLWAGGLETGVIQQMDKVTGNFFGPTVYIGGDIWDLTGPINCPQQIEICGNGLDDDGDNRIDSDDDDCSCPIIASSDSRTINICSGDDVTFSVVTDASLVPFHEFEFYRFESQQSNPYTSTDTKVLIGAQDIINGAGSLTSNDFPLDNYLAATYYIYAVLDDVPSDLTDCSPYLEYIVNAIPCLEVEVNCAEERTIETYLTGINNNLPKSLNFSDTDEIDSILLQIVYENNSPGASITVQGSDGTNYSLSREIINDIHLFEAVIPATGSITYTNQIHHSDAQSILAYVYKNIPSGKSYIRYRQTVSGIGVTKPLNFPLPAGRTETTDFKIKLPLSELTYDNRELTFRVTAGSYSNTYTKKWGSQGEGFPKGCCITLEEIDVNNVPPSVNTITVEVISKPFPDGQSFIIGGTLFFEIDCFENEDCTDNLDNDNDGDIDERDFECSGYCAPNGTFLPYGMLQLDDIGNDNGIIAEQYDMSFVIANNVYLYWESGNKFRIRGSVAGYQAGNYVGKYILEYTATGANYSFFNSDNILGSTGGSGTLTSLNPNATQYDEIPISFQPNSNGWGLIVREYDANDIRLEGNWSPMGSNISNTFSIQVSPSDCQSPREICGNGLDDDNDGLADCADPDCDNPNNGGTITGNENNCGIYTPTTITEQNAPNGGGNGILEYQWEYSLQGNNWVEISGAIESTFTPSLLTETTRFRRKVRAGSCNPWLTSNPVTKTVTPSTVDAQVLNPPGGASGYLCSYEAYTFETTPITDVNFTWNFGAFATPATATGSGPHSVTFATPTDSLGVNPMVILQATNTLDQCTDADSITFNLHPLSEVVTVDFNDPSVCGASDGWIAVTVRGEVGACIEVSLDGGLSYYPEGQLTFNGLSSGNYEIVTRYCNDNCDNFGEIVDLSDPATINVTNDLFANICPGFSYSSNVLINDFIVGETILSIAANGTSGTVTLEQDGEFVYTPNSATCTTDQFSYTVCDPGMNCCETAVVNLDFNDNEAPKLVNVPEDLTINCDEEIPLPPLVSATDNCPAISIDKNEKSTQGEEGCALFDYTLTYSWIAEDFCGNSVVDSQVIQVTDQTAPNLYRIYTLPNGKKLVAGVMQNVTNRWKAIQLPIEFETKPLIFSQLVTNNEPSPTIVRLRNISPNQFEIKLQEEANNDLLDGESVAWFAIEPGTQITDYQLEADKINVGDNFNTINFQQTFSQTPSFFTTMQSILDADPAYPRQDNLSSSSVSVKIQEESVNSDFSHGAEELAYLAIDTTVLTDQRGDVFGESGKLSINHNWQTIPLKNSFVNPVVIANSLSFNDNAPAKVQVKNVTSNSFDIRVQEWEYLDGAHAAELVSYIILEGSVPLNSDRFCESGTDSLVLGVDIVAVDNCDQNVTISYEETETFSGPRQIYSRVWFAVDDCGNETRYTRDITCEGVFLQLKAILQGATIYSEDGLMQDNLRKKGLIPLTEPYSANPNFNHVGEGGGEKMDPILAGKAGPDACVDWVFIELFDGNDINTVVATQSGIIQRDGDVMSAAGDTIIRFENIPPGNYYVALSHRNHLKTISLYPFTFTPSNTPFIDFTDEFTPVIGVEPNIDLGINGRALWSGDLNADGRVIYQGPQNDVFDMFLQIVLDSLNGNYLTNFISTGYTDSDFNLDGTVIFQGPNNDKSTLLFNTVLKHPNNNENFSNFVIATHAQAQILDGNNPEGTTPGFDFDNDGILDGLDPDDDNDGVADGSDIDPKNQESDSDNDGISDNTETGNDGHYDPLVDSDPLNACAPNISTNCMGIDDDGDGFFRNYPNNHALFDGYDDNPCRPDTNNPNCPCAISGNDNEDDNDDDDDEDDDDNQFIKVCHKKENGETQTEVIPLSALPVHLGHGDTCGPCNN